MGCGCHGEGGHPCGCKDCGSYTLDPMGVRRSQDGVELDYKPQWKTQKPRDVEPLGARLERAWYGDRSRETTATALPVGSSKTPLTPSGEGGPFGVAGSGHAVGPRSRPFETPIGTRPSASKKASINLTQIERPQPPPLMPYGRLPVELLPEVVFGLAAPGVDTRYQSFRAPIASTDGQQALRQFIPPPPAPQQPCIVNGFDPKWGEPPDEYMGVPLSFDPEVGAYQYDVAETMRGLNLGWSSSAGPVAGAAVSLGQQYATGRMLQPYKLPGRESPGDPWYFRWIAQRREVSCPTPE